MARPTSPDNTLGQSLDAIFTDTGAPRLKLAVGDIAPGSLEPDASWAGVATHVDGDSFAASDGVVLLAGVDATNDTTIRKILVDASGRLLAVAVPNQGVLTDASGTITAGGSAQSLFASNLARKYLLVQNQHATEDLWINFGTTAVVGQPSVKIVPGAALLMDGSGFVSTQSVSVIAATTAHAFTAKQG